jgi:hypothetical protein
VTAARIAAQSIAARTIRTTLVGLGLATALLTGLLTSSAAPAASGLPASGAVVPAAPVARAWEVLPEFPQRLTAWLYESQRQLSLSASPSAADRG